MPEIVYVFTNPAMPNYIKIGMTKRAELEMRLKELSRHAGVPEPFELVYAVEVDDARKVENALKEAFVEFRSSKRHSEFFKMKPAPIIAILKAIAKAEVSVMVQNKLDQHVTSVKSKTTTKNSRRGDRFSFGLAEIPVGATLTYKDDKSKKCKVINDAKVEYEGILYSLSGLTKRFQREAGSKRKEFNGASHFLYSGELLKDRRDKRYGTSKANT